MNIDNIPANNMPHITLSALNAQISEFLQMAFAGQFWVIAEIADIKQSTNGHLYLELVEKQNNTIIAKEQAVIWHNKGVEMRQKFGSDLPILLKKGNKVLFRAILDFHSLYGLKLIISDLDASVTLGELELRRRAILQQLQTEQLLQLNSKHKLPLVLQHIAVISSPTAAGYGDFIDHLQYNPYGYAIMHTLFAASMQGDNVENEIGAQLKAIASQHQQYHAVIIIRGGGSKLDLAAFDNYTLAAAVARFPLPVIIGIGHQQDKSILDLVAHTSLKTPTAVAEFVLNTFISFESQLIRCLERVKNDAKNKLNRQFYALKKAEMAFQYAVQKRIEKEEDFLQNALTRIKEGGIRKIQNEHRKLDLLQKRIELHDISRILKRGYAIIRKDGKAISFAHQLKAGDNIKIQFIDNEIQGNITENKTEE